MCCQHILNGEVPYAIIDLKTGERKEYNYLGQYSEDKRKAGELEIGFYAVYTTGSYYLFFDGKQCWNDGSDWGPPSTKYWQDTGGVHPDYAKYSFEYTPLSQWGNTITLNDVSFLSMEKHQPVIDSIYQGSGITNGTQTTSEFFIGVLHV